jgi:hypothetical protein
MHEESLLSGGCGKAAKNKSGKSKKSGSGKSRSGAKIPVVIPPVVVGLGY